VRVSAQKKTISTYHKGNRGNRGKKQTLESMKWVRKIRKQQNMKNIQSAFRNTKIGNTRNVTVIPVPKSLYIPLQSKKDCPRQRTCLSIHASPSISNYTISDFQEIWYRRSLQMLLITTEFPKNLCCKMTYFMYGHK